jgi:hypothetical protein
MLRPPVTPETSAVLFLEVAHPLLPEVEVVEELLVEELLLEEPVEEVEVVAEANKFPLLKPPFRSEMAFLSLKSNNSLPNNKRFLSANVCMVSL